MSGKKGSNAERALVKMFLEANWQALRIAGSGKMNLGPDVIAGHPGKLLVIECKATKKNAAYLKPQEILNTIDYANKFGAEPWYAIKFDRIPWSFIPAQDLLGNPKVVPDQGIKFDILILKHRKTMD